ncbi:hypothetical protein V1264_011328 [Littorina saxatilis]|uniref:Uncharacterized protein n=1 Tax=Littorina saxatilis TaxID=31220 RepID=A0AAN9BUU4_9CAEN
MGRCRFRPVAYQMGLCFVTLGFVLVALGYGLPTWLRLTRGRTEGLWNRCQGVFSSCSFSPDARGLREYRSDGKLLGVSVFDLMLFLTVHVYSYRLRGQNERHLC